MRTIDADAIFRMAKDMGFQIPFPITLEEMRNPLKSKFLNDVYIDEAIYLLQSLLYRMTGLEISAVTISTDDMKGDRI